MAIVHQEVGGKMQTAQDIRTACAVRAVGEDIGLRARGGDTSLERAVHGHRRGEKLIWELQTNLKRQHVVNEVDGLAKEVNGRR